MSGGVGGLPRHPDSDDRAISGGSCIRDQHRKGLADTGRRFDSQALRAEKMEDVPQDSGDEIGSNNRPSDRSLLRRFRSGSEDAAEILYHRYAHRLSALVRSRRPSDLANLVDYEDIVQS